MAKESIRRYLESGLIVGCATAAIYLVMSLMGWIQKEVAEIGFLATVAQLGSYVLENPIAIAWLCVFLVLFRILGLPYVLSALEDQDSFLSRLSVLVVGGLVVFGVTSLGVLTFVR
ncbi:hypothetical protein V8Z74_14615 [Comamonas sp. w2-DMI]|uniref:hypothetical protein n=1 Tax=Comamonas sp. w2-DMI TaxID=3126391 RepID=UPI0032E446BE